MVVQIAELTFQMLTLRTKISRQCTINTHRHISYAEVRREKWSRNGMLSTELYGSYDYRTHAVNKYYWQSRYPNTLPQGNNVIFYLYKYTILTPLVLRPEYHKKIQRIVGQKYCHSTSTNMYTMHCAPIVRNHPASATVLPPAWWKSMSVSPDGRLMTIYKRPLANLWQFMCITISNQSGNHTCKYLDCNSWNNCLILRSWAFSVVDVEHYRSVTGCHL